MNDYILITGSSRGIGRAIAKEAHKQGYKVIVHGRSESDELDSINIELEGSIKISFDISDRSQTLSKLEILQKEIGPIKYLVNNTGVRANPMSDLSDMNEDGATEEWRVNVLGTLNVITAVIEGMKKDGGSIVNIASIKGVFDLATMSSLTFSATKSGVISITKSLAKTYGPLGIRVNSVSPGYIETDQTETWGAGTIKRIEEGTLEGRLGQPEEIAPLVMHLISEEAKFMNGQNVIIDGGYSITGK